MGFGYGVIVYIFLYFALNEVYSYPKSYTFSLVHSGTFIVLCVSFYWEN